MMNVQKYFGFVAAVIIIACTSATWAGTVTVNWDGSYNGGNYNAYINGANAGFGGAGQFHFTVQGNDSGYWEDGEDLYGFCMEYREHISRGNTAYNIVDLQDAPQNDAGHILNGMGEERARLISKWWGQFYSEIGTDNLKARAFQVGIWELIYEDILDLQGQVDASKITNLQVTNGADGANDFYDVRSANSAVHALANGWLEILAADYTSLPEAGLLGLSKVGRQDMVVADPTSITPPSVPLPLGAWMGLSSLGLLGIGRKLRRD